mmetsp:Transcript_7623/g.15548  ORF Transcript_7623/g.15548 Transcript_7623/m.15548 type:complete len:231 (-) Transcript_7623:569-1261(-)
MGLPTSPSAPPLTSFAAVASSPTASWTTLPTVASAFRACAVACILHLCPFGFVKLRGRFRMSEPLAEPLALTSWVRKLSLWLGGSVKSSVPDPNSISVHPAKHRNEWRQPIALTMDGAIGPRINGVMAPPKLPRAWARASLVENQPESTHHTLVQQVHEAANSQLLAPVLVVENCPRRARAMRTMGEKKASEWPTPVSRPCVSSSCHARLHSALQTMPITESAQPTTQVR